MMEDHWPIDSMQCPKCKDDPLDPETNTYCDLCNGYGYVSTQVHREYTGAVDWGRRREDDE